MRKDGDVILVSEDGERLGFHCPGCGYMHAVNSGWTFNGDVKKPTFSPSILVTSDYGPEHIKRVCHSFVKDGMIQFLPDCTHALAGQTVPLEPY